ncbi:protein zer-1 homolog [Lineus longissimus]|uniref:protein zer-1 homolog n=1 Tax=Lineus longissimus TaxID=88925 RepID=UPI00315C582C
MAKGGQGDSIDATMNLKAVDTLIDLCINTCVRTPRILCDLDIAGNHNLREGLTLPTNVCDSLLKAYQTLGICITDKILHMFTDTKRTRLSRVNLRQSRVTDDGFEVVAVHNPLELDITGCRYLTLNCVHFINRYCKNLRALHINEWEALTDIEIFPTKVLAAEESIFGGDFIYDCPEMRVFSARCDRDLVECGESNMQDILATMLNPFDKLHHLDLSGLGSCGVDIGTMDWLRNMKCLTFLVLHNVITSEDTKVAIEVLSCLKGLRFLDISHEDEDETTINYKEPEKALRHLVTSLPNLTSLDISGTNLAGLESMEQIDHRLFTPADGKTLHEEQKPGCCINGLEGRHLEFLGLFKCSYQPCERRDIPATNITGDANEDQILLAIKTYYDRSGMVQKALDALFQMIRTSVCEKMREELGAIVTAMRRHPLDRHIQISGSASLFYIIKSGIGKKVAMKDRRQAILTLVDAMEEHFDEPVMMRNGCLTLCHFDIPRDVLFAFKRIVLIMLRLIRPPSAHEDFVQGIAIYLLNSLACQVDGSEKQLVGDLGAVDLMLSVIQTRLNAKQCDDIMEVAWSTLWNITDETAVNCERFLQGNGMQLFIRCLEEWTDKHDLLRNMMGLMGNVAEVKALRSKLMVKQFVQIFSDLLDSDSDGIEVSYNAAGVLAHMASDRPDVWLIDSPSREAVLARLVDAIERWDITSSRNINYRSFEPILRLLPVYETPAVQHWASWALCNLTQVYPEKYCRLLEREGGLVLLDAITKDPRPNPRIKALAAGVLKTVADYFEEQSFQHKTPAKGRQKTS